MKRALLSVTHKQGLADFAKGLSQLGFELLSTGGTAAHLKSAGLAVLDVAQVTGFPEMLDGRVKTLHPRIHGAILARQDDPGHMRQLQEHDIRPIDLVCVNLYAFGETVAKPGCTLAEALENIDIGGPCLIRASAKNHPHVIIVTSPADYDMVLNELRAQNGQVSQEIRRALAAKAFKLTSEYDQAIFAYLSQF